MTKNCLCGRKITWILYGDGPSLCDRCKAQAQKTKEAVEAVKNKPVIHESIKGLST